MISATVTFATKVSSNSPDGQLGWVASSIAVSTVDLKSLGINKLKTRVLLRFKNNSEENSESGAIACFHTVVTKKANDKHGVVCLHKMWQPMFDTTLVDDVIKSPSSTHGHENRRVEISRVPSRFAIDLIYYVIQKVI